METKELKGKRIDLRASKTDEQNLLKAAEKMGTTKISEVIFSAVENFANLPPEMYYCDRYAIRQIDSYIEYIRTHLTNFINEFINVTGQSCTLKDIELMFQNWGSLGATQIIQNAIKDLIEQTMIKKLKGKYPGLHVEVPVLDFTLLFELANKLTEAPVIKYKSGFYCNCFAVSKSGDVTVLSDQVEKLKDNYRASAENPQELKRLSMVKSLCELVNSFIKDKDFLPEQIPALFYFDRESAKFEPTGTYIKNSAPRLLPE